MKELPAISVIMPVFNSEKYIREAIDSILSQTFTDFEFIIIDDASTDSTMDIIQSYVDKRIMVIHNSINLGNYASRNIGLKKAKGKYIAVMDADDQAFPDRFIIQYKYMEENPDVLVCGSRFYINNCVVEKPLTYEDIQIALLQDNCFLHSSLFIRKEVISDIGGYNEEYYYSSDYDLLCNISLVGRIVNLPDILMRYRTHTEQISHKYNFLQKYYANRIRESYKKSIFERIPLVTICVLLDIVSEDYENNFYCVLKNLLQLPFVQINLLEIGKKRHFFDTQNKRIHYSYVYDENKRYNKSHYINLLLKNSRTSIVGIWNAQVLIPVHQIIAAIWSVENGGILCFPYDGNYQYLSESESDNCRNDIETINQKYSFPFKGRPSVQGVFFVNRDRFLLAGGENECFQDSDLAAVERIKRLDILQLPVCRTKGTSYHLYNKNDMENVRVKEPYYQKLLLEICKLTKDHLRTMINRHSDFFSYMTGFV